MLMDEAPTEAALTLSFIMQSVNGYRFCVGLVCLAVGHGLLKLMCFTNTAYRMGENDD
jgi:hypothetical protein